MNPGLTIKPAPIPRLRKVNNWLTGVPIALSVYILATPFLPQVTWYIDHDTPFSTNPTVTLPAAVAESKQERPKQNILVIPRINLWQEIFDGSDASTLDKGLWRRPAISTPDAGGNTVIVG